MIRRVGSHARSLATIIAIFSLLGGFATPANAGKDFAVVDGAAIAVFGDMSFSDKVSPLTWSPNHEFIAVVVGRGNISQNMAESELRVYSASSLESLIRDKAESIQPVLSIKKATWREGPVIEQIQWTTDSSGLAFLLRETNGRLQLMYVNLETKVIEHLSREDQDVTAFSVATRRHYVYAVRDPDLQNPAIQTGSPSVDVTGMTLGDLLFPASIYPQVTHYSDRSKLWADDGRAVSELYDPGTKKPFVLFDEGLRSLRISPNGRWIVVALPLQDVPKEWPSLYEMSPENGFRSIAAGSQDVAVRYGEELVSRYAVIDLRSGKTITPSDAPTGRAAGWFPFARPVWSSQSDTVLLPSAFLHAQTRSNESGIPCVAAYNLPTAKLSCVVRLDGFYSERRNQSPALPIIVALGFEDTVGRVIRLALEIRGKPSQDQQWRWSQSGGWMRQEGPQSTTSRTSVEVQQSFKDPPILIVRDTSSGRTRPVWNPNPQLADINLAQASRFHWVDSTGRSWVGGVYRPPGSQIAHRYPLVIQTHGFSESEFRESGIYPTAFAAQALAASGFVVLQVQDCNPAEASDEAACQVQGYSSAIKRLSDEGLIDPQRVGIIGFSRTCYYVLDALTKDPTAFQAASITDGFNAGYWQYIESVDELNNEFGKEVAAANGGPPYGPSLPRWFEHAPTFNTDKIKTPMLIVGEGLGSLMSMWEPYALLRYQNKPVDMVLLNTDEHVLTNPATRMASQQGSVDWMRFWLQGVEDSAPEKAAQYRRWEKLCDLQISEKTGQPTFCVSSTSPQAVH